MSLFLVTVSFAGLVALPSPTHADRGLLEAGGGVAIPIAGADYSDFHEPGLKLVVRGTMQSQRAPVALELSLDWTPWNRTFDDRPTVNEDRVRMLVGARITRPLTQRFAAFARAAAGADLASSSSQAAAGGDLLVSVRDLGIALEIGGGIKYTREGVSVSGQVALPFAAHFDGELPQDAVEVEYNYKAIDLDLLFCVGLNF